jgi:hypothetical protein
MKSRKKKKKKKKRGLFLPLVYEAGCDHRSTSHLIVSAS